MFGKRISLTLIVVVSLLVVFGNIMIYSASNYTAELQMGDSFFYVKKQLLGVALGVGALILLAHLDTSVYYKFRYIIYGISILLLALVFVPGLGVESYGAKRWINLGIITIQPSEISKFGLMILLACIAKEKDMHKWKNVFLMLIYTGVICLLIMLEPNMSITMCVFISVFILLIACGLPLKKLIILAIPAVLGVIALIVIEPYRLSRLMAYIDPWSSPLGEGYQLIQSYYAIGNGGLFGVGLFNSRQKYMFLPFAESDFIFSIICEELGLVGATIVLLMYFVVVLCGIKIASKCDNVYDTYLAVSITAIIAVQTLLNIAVVSGSIPPTGLPLPFISAGGSSVAVFMGAIGILLNINKRNTHRLNYCHKI